MQTWRAFSTQESPWEPVLCLVLAAQTVPEPSDPAGSRLLRGCPCGPSSSACSGLVGTWLPDCAAVKEPPASKSS